MLEEHFHGGCPRLPERFEYKCPGCEHPGLEKIFNGVLHGNKGKSNQGYQGTRKAGYLDNHYFRTGKARESCFKILEIGITQGIFLHRKDNFDFQKSSGVLNMW